MSRFKAIPTPLLGLHVLERTALGDERGFLSRLFCADELQTVGWQGSVAQINHTLTRDKATVRGMHFQREPHAEFKLVTCVAGEVWDVAVDLRMDSPTYLQWFAQILSAQNKLSMLIPAGFAHGFQSLSDNVELIYVHSQAYHQPSEAGLRATDPHIAINWPLPIGVISDRDSTHPWVDQHFRGVKLA